MQLIEDNFSQILHNASKKINTKPEFICETIKNVNSFWESNKNFNTANFLLNWFTVKDISKTIFYSNIDSYFHTKYYHVVKNVTVYLTGKSKKCHGCDEEFVNMFCPTHGIKNV